MPHKSWKLTQVRIATKCNRATFSWCEHICCMDDHTGQPNSVTTSQLLPEQEILHMQFTCDHFKTYIFWGNTAINVFYNQIQKMKFLSQRTKKPCSMLTVIDYLNGNASIWADSASAMNNINYIYLYRFRSQRTRTCMRPAEYHSHYLESPL